MALGPGRYDAEVTAIRERYNAHGVILIVLDGSKGQGFSCQASPEILLRIPTMLRSMADQIDKDQLILKDLADGPARN